MNKQKGFAVIEVLMALGLIVVIVGGGIYYFVQTKDDGIQTIKTIDISNADYGENIAVFVEGKTEKEALISIYDYKKGEVIDSIEVPNKKAVPPNPFGFGGEVGFYFNVDPTQ